VEAQHLRARVLAAELVARDLRPEIPGRAKLCDLFEEIVVRVPKKRDARRDRVEVDSGRQRGA